MQHGAWESTGAMEQQWSLELAYVDHAVEARTDIMWGDWDWVNTTRPVEIRIGLARRTGARRMAIPQPSERNCRPPDWRRTREWTPDHDPGWDPAGNRHTTLSSPSS
jgi:hypothetical protein